MTWPNKGAPMLAEGSSGGGTVVMSDHQEGAVNGTRAICIGSVMFPHSILH